MVVRNESAPTGQMVHIENPTPSLALLLVLCYNPPYSMAHNKTHSLKHSARSHSALRIHPSNAVCQTAIQVDANEGSMRK